MKEEGEGRGGLGIAAKAKRENAKQVSQVTPPPPRKAEAPLGSVPERRRPWCFTFPPLISPAGGEPTSPAVGLRPRAGARPALTTHPRRPTASGTESLKVVPTCRLMQIQYASDSSLAPFGRGPGSNPRPLQGKATSAAAKQR